MDRGSRNNKKQFIIIGAGALLRLFYVLFSSIYERQYDIGMIDLSAGHTVSGGHLAYIQYLFHNLRLPDMDPTTVYQFHHPPFHHYVCALLMRFLNLFTDNTAFLEESIQVVPFVCSLILLVGVFKITEELSMSEAGKNLTLILFSFHPSMILLSGSVNNDCMALMFTVLTILFAIRYGREASFKNIILMAIFLGLGITTKQNVAEIAFPIAAMFIYILVKNFQKSKESGLKTLLQYVVFGVISIPIGMWFYIRNLIKYNTDIMWVYELPVDSWQYTGNVPLLYRFLWPNPADMIENIRSFKVGCGYNIWVQIIRTSVLGEWDMANTVKSVKVLSLGLMFFGALIALIALISFLRKFVFVRTKNCVIKVTDRIILVLTYFTVMVFYLWFVYKYPQECSMHFRYIEILLLPTILALGFSLETWKKGFYKLFKVLLYCFVACGILMTGVWCFG